MYTIYTEQTVSEKDVVIHFLTKLSMGKIITTKDNEAPVVRDIRETIQGLIQSIHIDRFKEITVDTGNTLYNMYTVSIDNLKNSSQNFLHNKKFPAPINTLGGVFIHNKTLYIPAGIFMAFDGVMQKLNKDNPNTCEPKLIELNKQLNKQLKTLEDTCNKQPVQKDDVNIEEERKQRIKKKEQDNAEQRKKNLQDILDESKKLKIENSSLQVENEDLQNQIVVLKAYQKAQRAPSTVSELYERFTAIIYKDDNTTISDKFLNMFLKPTDDDQSKVLKLQTILQDITLRPYNIKKYNGYELEEDPVGIKGKSLGTKEDMLKALDDILYNNSGFI